MECVNCGKKIAKSVLFCPNCGTKQEKKQRSIKKIAVVFLSLLLMLSIFLFVLGIFRKNQFVYGDSASSVEVSFTYQKNGVPKFIDGAFSNRIVTSFSDVIEALEDIKDIMQFQDISEELVVVSQEVNEGITYYRFQQVYQDIPVYHQDLIVAVSKDNRILGLSGYYIPNIHVDTFSFISEEEVSCVVTEYLGNGSNIFNSELSILATDEEQVLVYDVLAFNNIKAVELLVDANSKEVLSEADLMESVSSYTYTGFGMDEISYTITLEEYQDVLPLKKRYRFYDANRNISVADYRYIGYIFASLASAVPGTTPIEVDIQDGQIDMTFENKEFIASAITAMAHFEKIYDYYYNVLGRNSYDNKGSKVIVNLGVTSSTFSNDDLNNAFWSTLTNQMFIGNWKGRSLSASLDALGHEFTHGVISYTSNFANTPKKGEENQAFETGALNEGYADILGSLIEGKNWTIAENNEILRDGAHPENYNHPSVKGGTYYYPDGYLRENQSIEDFLKEFKISSVIEYDTGGIHQNANVVLHAAYLMYTNGAFESMEQMAKVWYNSLLLLSSYSNFEDCALAVIKTAKNMRLSEQSIYTITQAFIDTNMLEEKDYLVSGTIFSGQRALQEAQVEILTFKEEQSLFKVKGSKDGTYELNLLAGTYKIRVTKNGFQDFTGVLVVKSKTKYDVYLASNLKLDKSLEQTCTSDQCFAVTIYFLDSDSNGDLDEVSETFMVDAGTIVSSKVIVDAVNKSFGKDLISSDGKTFSMNYGTFTQSFSWYYKGTNDKFDWDKPISEDVEIEMKININDFFETDDEMLKEIYDAFKR